MTTSTLTLRRGDDEILDVQVTSDEAGLEPIEPPGLTVYPEIWFTAKRRMSDTDDDAVFQKTLGAGVTVDPDDSSMAMIEVDAADTAALPAQVVRLVWDLQIKDDDDRIRTIASGTLAVSPDVTRATGDES